TNMGMSAVIAGFFLKQGGDTHVLVHRDGDCMLPDEVAWYYEREATKIPNRCELFVTPPTDVEHEFCRPGHLRGALNMSLQEAERIITRIIEANNASFAADFTNKRNELKSKVLRDKENVPSAADMLGATTSFEQTKGKRLFGLLNAELTRLGHNPMRLL